MTANQQRLSSSIREPDVAGGRLLATLLQHNGIYCALWAVSAAVHYGGGLCPLDIEIVVNAADQQRVFDLLLSLGLSISTSDSQAGIPASFEDWQHMAVSISQYRDRRKTRMVTPIYELPATGDSLDDMLRPFIVVYSAEEVGLPCIPSPASIPELKPRPPYTALSDLDPDLALNHDESSSQFDDTLPIKDLLVPSFEALVRSEMHVLLARAAPHSPVWGQHMAQLSELVYCRACANRLENLEEVVADAKLDEFISWFRASLRGQADYEKLDSLRASYRQVYDLIEKAPESVATSADRVEK